MNRAERLIRNSPGVRSSASTYRVASGRITQGDNMAHRLTDEDIGKLVIEFIHKQEMIDVKTLDVKTNSHRREPNPVIWEWMANSTDQLGAFIRDIHKRLNVEPAVNDDDEP